MLIFDKLCVLTLWMSSHSVFVDVSMMHLIAKICLVWQQTTKESQKANFSQAIKNFSLVQTIVVSPGETNLTTLPPSHSPHSLKDRSSGLNGRRSSNIYLFKIKHGNIKSMCEMRSKLTIMSPEQRQLITFCTFTQSFYC